MASTDNTNIGAILTIDTKVQQRLEKAQLTLRRMAETSEKIEATFARINSSGLIDTTKIQPLDEALGLKSIRADIQAIAKAISAISHRPMDRGAAGNIGDVSAVRESISETRRAAASLRDNELSDLQEGMFSFNNSLLVCSRNAKMLSNILISVFNPFLISQFLSQLIQVRGEFEMTEKSLTVVLGDAAKASEIFNTIQEISVRSPFAVKDLVSYTRQLAAFRIETDKLVETTQMLGDIAAGVGVDMNRLILAYGQVKAAEYLKGSELRQFSEAGVNMLGGLADRFSEIYGRAVSVGEVFEMVSKRMVRFADVEAVLQRATSAGGTFYQMQARQADTLQGHIVNLRDRLDIMFNEIGTSYEGLIKGIVSGMESIIASWKGVSAVVVPVVMSKLVTGALSLMNVGIKNLTRQMSLVNRYISVFGRNLDAAQIKALKLNAAIKSMGGWVSVITFALTAMANLAVVLSKTHREVRELLQASNDEYEAAASKLERMIGLVSDTGVQESLRSKALSDIKAEYGNVISLQGIDLNNAYLLNERKTEYLEMLREQRALEAQMSAYEKLRDRLERGRNVGGTGVTEVLQDLRGMLDELPKLQAIMDRSIQSELLERIEKGVFYGEIENSEQALRSYLDLIRNYIELSEEEYNRLFDSLRGNAEYVFAYIFRQYEGFERMRRSVTDFDWAPSSTAYLKEVKDFSTNFMRQFQESLSPDQESSFDHNPAARALALHDWMQDQLEQMRRVVENDEFGKGISESMKDRLLANIDKTFAQLDPLTNGVERALRESASRIYEEFGNLVVSFEAGSDLYKSQEETLSEYYVRVRKIVANWQRGMEILRSSGDISTKQETGRTWIREWTGEAQDVQKAIANLDKQIQATYTHLENTFGNNRFIIDESMASKLQNYIRELKNASNKMLDLTTEGREAYLNRIRQMQEELGFFRVDMQFDVSEASVDEIDQEIARLTTMLGENRTIPLMLELIEEDTAQAIKKQSQAARTLIDEYQAQYDLFRAGERGQAPSIDALIRNVQSNINALNKLGTASAQAQIQALEKDLARLQRERKSDAKKWREEQLSGVIELTEAVKRAISEFDQLDDKGDALLMEKLRQQAEKLGIEIPDVIDTEFIDSLIGQIQDRFQHRPLDLLIEWDKEKVEQQVKQYREQVDKLWEDYDMALKLESWGLVMPDLQTAQILDKIKQVEDALREMSGVSAAEDLLSSITERRLENIRSGQEDAAKLIYESQKQAASETERIYQEMVEDIRVMSASTLSETDVSAGVASRIKKAFDEMNKAQWDAYKGSQMYALAFGDLEGLGVQALTALKNQLESMPMQGLSPSDTKTISDRIRLIRSEIIRTQASAEAFGVIAQGFRDIYEAARLQNEDLPEARAQFEQYSEAAQRANLQKEISDRAAAQALTQRSEALNAYTRAQEEFTKSPTEDNRATLSESESALSQAEALWQERSQAQAQATLEAQNATERLSEATLNLSIIQSRVNTLFESAPRRLEEIRSKYQAVGEAIDSMIGLAKESVEAFGGELTESTKAALDGFSKGFGLVGAAIGSASSLMTGFNALVNAGVVSVTTLQSLLTPLLVAAVAVGAMVAWVKKSEADRVQSIKEHQKAVDTLGRSYDRLQEKMRTSLTLNEMLY